jgi:hypothetical protein
MKYKDVTIYHIYKDDELACGARTFWYGTDPKCSDNSGEYAFDVRELPQNGHDAHTDDGRKAIIREAIDAGLITKDGLIEEDIEPPKEASPGAKAEEAREPHGSCQAEKEAVVLQDLKHDSAVLEAKVQAVRELVLSLAEDVGRECSGQVGSLQRARRVLCAIENRQQMLAPELQRLNELIVEVAMDSARVAALADRAE